MPELNDNVRSGLKSTAESYQEIITKFLENLTNAIVIVYSHLKLEAGKERPETRLRRHQLSFVVALISYVALNAIVVNMAKAG